MRKLLMWRIAGVLTLFLTMSAFVLGGSSVSYAASVHQAAAVAASITVAQNPLIENTTGNFVGTVSGRGLHSNAVYALTDNNFQCTDSINNAGFLLVITDLNGRFSVPFLGGPSFFSSAPCLSGRFTITATLATLPGSSLTTTFKIQPPTSFGPTHSFTFNPNPAVISTSGDFVSTFYGTGWTAGKAFAVFPITNACASLTFTTSPTGFVDGDGNFAVGLRGVGCNAGTIKFIATVGTSSHIVTLHFAAPGL